MRILHVRPRLGIGGATEYLIRLAEGLASNQHQVVVACGGGEWIERLRPFARCYDDLSLAPRVGPGRAVPNVAGLFRSAIRLVQIIRRESIDVVNTHHRFAALVSRVATRIARVPLVSTMHELRDDNRRLTTLALGERVVTLSGLVQRYVIDNYGIAPDRVHIIPMGVTIPAPLSDIRRHELAHELELDLQAPIIGCVARLVPRKGQIHLIEAIPTVLTAHPQAQFVFVGKGEDRERLEVRARELGIMPQVRFTGARPEIGELFGLFDFSVLPSLEEEFGIVLVESFAQRRPVVATTVGGIPEIVRPHENGLLVPPRDSKALGAAISELLDNPERIASYGERGYELVQQQYSAAQFLGRTEMLYQSLIG